MRFLGLALFAEGPTDHLFLSALLTRVVRHMCAHEATEPVDLGEMRHHHSPGRSSEAPREERIFEAARADLGAWDILFIHTDGSSDWQTASAARVAPAVRRLERELSSYQGRAVSVVPVRETEAWMLVDGDALREVFGTRVPDERLGIPPHPADAEKLLDPKEVLKTAFQSTAPRRATRRRGWDSELLAEAVSLPKLGKLRSYKRFEKELRSALRDLRFIP